MTHFPLSRASVSSSTRKFAADTCIVIASSTAYLNNNDAILFSKESSDPWIAELYNLWYEQKENVFRTYQDTIPKRIPLSANKEFNSIKNAVIQEALNILHNRITFEEDMQQETETPAETMTYTSETTSKRNPWTDPNDMHVFVDYTWANRKKL